MKTFNNTIIKKVISHLKENYEIILQPIWDEETNQLRRNNYSFIHCDIYESKYCGFFISPQALQIECTSKSRLSYNKCEAVDMIVMIPSGFVDAEELIATIDKELKHYLTSALLKLSVYYPLKQANKNDF